jgi:outer membrane protein assembly factor BamE (lipoprotein component of BamABCDE complex)
MNSSRLLLPAALCLCIGSSSCLIGTSSRTENTGKYVSQNTLAQIQPGKDKAYVLALIGEPTTKSTIDGNTEIWKWCYTEQKNSSGHVIFLVSSDKRIQTEHTTFVEFYGSSVVKAWTD